MSEKTRIEQIIESFPNNSTVDEIANFKGFTIEGTQSLVKLGLRKKMLTKLYGGIIRNNTKC